MVLTNKLTLQRDEQRRKGHGPMTDSFEEGNDRSGSVKDEEFLD